MRSFSFPMTLRKEKQGGLTVRFVDLPEAITSGVDRDDALIQAADCLDEAVAGRITDGLDIPEPSKPKRGQVVVPVPAAMAAKAALYLAMRSRRMTNSALARKLGIDEKEVRRMLDPRHPTKLPRIHEALSFLGKRLVVSLAEEAA